MGLQHLGLLPEPEPPSALLPISLCSPVSSRQPHTAVGEGRRGDRRLGCLFSLGKGSEQRRNEGDRDRIVSRDRDRSQEREGTGNQDRRMESCARNEGRLQGRAERYWGGAGVWAEALEGQRGLVTGKKTKRLPSQGAVEIL